ncbi:nucleotidyltransferase family protein [Tsuneonella amylolytica]|uniref:nucleotidyltransferase family protein n=1 Tax=Tsuneonella amylolytica TaxID=2338327 RepID=UPI000EAA0219|nr:nucleotidyltransferase family protein [Tsuneonella amylolytica]
MPTNGCALISDRRGTAFALLAAGRGARFGPGKLTADLAGKPLWRRSVDAAFEASIDAIVVVTNDAAIAAMCAAEGWQAVANPDAASGIASSVQVAARATDEFDRTIVALADMPFVEPAHIAALVAAGGTAFTCLPGGRPGVPAAFDRAGRARLAVLTGDRGAAALDWPDAHLIQPADPESLLDVDTPEALERARALAVRRWPAASR